MGFSTGKKKQPSVLLEKMWFLFLNKLVRSSEYHHLPICSTCCMGGLSVNQRFYKPVGQGHHRAPHVNIGLSPNIESDRSLLIERKDV